MPTLIEIVKDFALAVQVLTQVLSSFQQETIARRLEAAATKFEAATTKFEAATQTFSDAVGGFKPVAGTEQASSAGDIAAALERVHLSVQAIEQTLTLSLGVNASLVSLFKDTGTLTPENLGLLATAFGQIEAAVGSLDEEKLEALAEVFSELSNAGTSAGAGTGPSRIGRIEDISTIRSAAFKFKDAAETIAAAAADFKEAVGGFAGRGGETIGFFPGLEPSRGAVFGFAGAGRPAFLADLDEAIERTNSGIRESMELETELGKVTERVFSQMEGVLERFASTGEIEWGRFADAGLAALRDVVTGIQETLGIPSVGQSLGVILGSLFGGFAVGGAGTKLLHGRQTGGPVGAGVVTLVGEGGPELFVPRVPGEIISNDNLKHFVGRPQIVQNFNIDARAAAPGTERRIVRAIQDAENRAVRRSFALIADRNARGALDFV